MTTGEAPSNHERSFHRNSPIIKKVEELLPKVGLATTTSLMYQYCAYCNQVEAYWYTYPNIPEDLDLSHTRLPKFTWKVKSANNDHIKVNTGTTDYFIDREGYCLLLMDAHRNHIQSQQCRAQTANIDRFKWMSGLTGRQSISNTIRAIPGVRHLDVDLIIYDPNTHKPTLLLEESQDATKNWRGTKYLGLLMDCPSALILRSDSKITDIEYTAPSLDSPKSAVSIVEVLEEALRYPHA